MSCLGTYLSLVTTRTRSGTGGDTCFVTEWIWGTSPGSKKAYAALLNVVPISRAMTSLREAPE